MGFSKGFPSVSLKDILKEVNEYQILKYYLGINKLPAIIKSPIRIDKHPSFGIVCLSNFSIKYKDFATGDSGDVFKLLMQYFEINFITLLLKIKEDLYKIKQLNVSNNVVITKNNTKIHSSSKSSKNTCLKIKIRDWKSYDIEYWNQYGISIDLLKMSNTFPISHIFSNGCFFNADKYAYAYLEHKDGVNTYKIYQPFSSKYKWRNSHNSSTWDLWDMLPCEGEKLIVTSSRKDALTIISNLGIPATSLQAEGYLPKKQVIEELKRRFKTIYILYDNDYNKPINYGRNYSKVISDEFKLKSIEIPDFYKSKDPSDLYKNHGKETFIKVINKLIN